MIYTASDVAFLSRVLLPALFLMGFGALGWWAASSVSALYRRSSLGLSYRLYLLLPRLWGRLVERKAER